MEKEMSKKTENLSKCFVDLPALAKSKFLFNVDVNTASGW